MTTLTAFANGLWTAEADNFIGRLAWFPVRMTVAVVGDGVWICNPIALDDELVAAVDAVGPVRWIVEPNGFHSKWAQDACDRWPDAQLLCSDAHTRLGTKLPSWSPLDSGQPEAWADVFDSMLIEGSPKVAETVFLHKPSGTLITTDLLFNIHTTKRWMMRWVLGLAGAWKRPMQSRLWRLATRDRAAAGASCRRMLQWQFDRVLMAHGTPLTGEGARAELTSALHWMLGGAPQIASS